MTALHWFGDLVRGMLGTVPLPVARGLFVAVPVAVLVWVLTLPRNATTPDGDHPRWGDNLKIWAAMALLLQIVIYCLF